MMLGGSIEVVASGGVGCSLRRASAAASAAVSWLQRSGPVRTPPEVKLRRLQACLGWKISMLLCDSPLRTTVSAPCRPAQSTSSASGVTNGSVALFFTSMPVQVITSRSLAESSPSSSPRRISSRGSVSPSRSCRATRSSLSCSAADIAVSSNPARQTTRNGTLRKGIIEVAVIPPVSNGCRPAEAVRRAVSSVLMSW